MFSHSCTLSISLRPCLSQSFSLVLSSSPSNPPPVVFYLILSKVSPIKPTKAHQGRPLETRLGKSWLGCVQLIFIKNARVPNKKSALQIFFFFRVIHDEMYGERHQRS